MPKINYPRLIIGGLIAAVIMFVTDGFFHEQIVKADWQAVYANLRATEPAPHGLSLVYFAIFELGRGMITLVLYSTLRAFCGAGPKTAVCAAIAGWELGVDCSSTVRRRIGACEWFVAKPCALPACRLAVSLHL